MTLRVADRNAVTPVLEIGGTHVTSALVSEANWTVVASRRFPIIAHADAATLISALVEAARAIDASPGQQWGVAMPGPFDYLSGVGRFDAVVDKFHALNGVDVRAELRRELGGEFAFLNDADAFVLGESVAGSAAGMARCLGLTLGTEVGSGWLVDGHCVFPKQPADGEICRVRVDGRLLTDTMSRQAIRRSFANAGGDPAADVKDIADKARVGNAVAANVLRTAGEALGKAVSYCSATFAPDAIIIGGSMAAAWDLFAEGFHATATPGTPKPTVSPILETSPIIGAAVHSRQVLLSRGPVIDKGRLTPVRSHTGAAGIS